MTSKKDFLGILTTVLAVYFSTCGLVYYTTFYNAFGVKVLSFLDTSEIFLGLFEALYQDVFKNEHDFKYSFCFYTLLGAELVLWIIKENKKETYFTPFHKYKNRSEKNWIMTFLIDVIVCIIFALLVGTFYAALRCNVADHSSIFGYRMLSCASLFVSYYMALQICKNFTKRVFDATETSLFVLLFFVAFMGFSVSIARKNAFRIFREGYKSIRFTYQGTLSIATDTNLVFIGGLKNVIFLYRKDLVAHKNKPEEGPHFYMVFDRSKIDVLQVYSSSNNVNKKIIARDTILEKIKCEPCPIDSGMILKSKTP